MEPYVGQLQPFGFGFPPRGWAFCNGQLMAISQNEALFSLIGTTFGGDGRTTFGLPDMRGRTFLNSGTGPGLSQIIWGQRIGNRTVTMTTETMPNHNHAVAITPGSTDRGSNTTNVANGNYLGNLTDMYRNPGASSGSLAGASTTNTGSNTPIPIRNPFVGIYVSIALVGIYPSRN